MSIDTLTREVARHLSGGKKIVIRFRYPAVDTASGQTYKAVDGTLFIDIAPVESSIKKFRTYLHELAHARFDYEWIPADDKQSRSSGSVRISPGERADWSASEREIRANKQAAEWLEFAEKYAHKYASPGEPLVQTYLRTLLDWRR